MHCRGHIITKKLPTRELLNEILKPYHCEEENNESGFDWDWWQIGGRYGGGIKIHFDPNENEDNWFCLHDRNNKYFISAALDELKENIKFYDELDWLQYMGLKENTLYVDGGYSKDFIDFDISSCYVVIDEEGKIYTRETWNGEAWKQHLDFDNKVKEIDLTDKFITVIDFHY